MHTHHILSLPWPSCARGLPNKAHRRARDLHRNNCKSDPPAVILAALPTFPENQTTWVPSAVWEGSPRPRAVDGKGEPQTRGVRANAAATLMLSANLMRWSIPPTRWVSRGVEIGRKGSKKKKMKQTREGRRQQIPANPFGNYCSTPRVTCLFGPASKGVRTGVCAFSPKTYRQPRLLLCVD